MPYNLTAWASLRPTEVGLAYIKEKLDRHTEYCWRSGVRRSVGSGPFQFGGCRDVGNGLGYVRVSADTSQASVLTRIMQWPYDCITGKELSTSSCFPKTHLPKYPSGITLMSRVHCFFSWVVICASENRHFGKILGTKSHRSQCARKHAQGCHVSQAALLSYIQEHE